MIRGVIRNEFGVKLSDVSVGRLLRKMWLSLQKSFCCACQRDNEKIEACLEIGYPEIRKLAKNEGATIYFCDEISVRSDYHSGATWAPVGKALIIESTGARFELNLVLAMSSKGQIRFMTIEKKMNAEKFIEFLERLFYSADTPIFLILDGYTVHKSRLVNEFSQETRGLLRFFILPPHSPNLNSDE